MNESDTEKTVLQTFQLRVITIMISSTIAVLGAGFTGYVRFTGEIKEIQTQLKAMEKRTDSLEHSVNRLEDLLLDRRREKEK